MPKHIVKAGGFTGTPSSVVIDVYDDEAPAVLLATIPNANITRVAATDVYVCNLKTITPNIGLPEDGSLTEKFYTLIWRDDTGVKIIGDYAARGFLWAPDGSSREIRETPIYPSATVPSRGITQNVIDAGKPSYMKVELAPDLDFATPTLTYYLIFAYDSDGRVASRTPSLTPPSP